MCTSYERNFLSIFFFIQEWAGGGGSHGIKKNMGVPFITKVASINQNYTTTLRT